jgi:hypothetical protein
MPWQMTLVSASTRMAMRTDGRRILTLTGADDVALLYAAYRFAEHLGVRFALHGDILPDAAIPLQLPDIDESHRPIFAVRGILPFHDFTEGPDWWSADDYKAYLAQLAKLRMNFLGMHCYPEGNVGPEPLIWIGHPDDIAADGSVTVSPPSRWASTRGSAWGYDDVPTSDFAAGAAMLFPTDDFGPAVTDGHRPLPIDDRAANEVFNRAAAMLRDVFDFGRPLGMTYCVGTESPLTVPERVADRLRERGLDPEDPDAVRLLYQGIFERLDRAHGVDYYWLWTPEGWTWSGTTDEQVRATVDDINLALEALDTLDHPIQLATSGWVLGPPNDRALFDETLPKSVPLSCINRQVGFDPVEPAFAAVSGRSTWAIPWLEDDPAMIIPQLWAGRMRRDAADAHAYGCDGLIGIHWRTRVLDPNVAALADAAWTQHPWNPRFDQPPDPPTPRRRDVHLGGRTADHPNDRIAGTDTPRIYQTCRWRLDGYHIDLPPGRYDVTLQFCEIHYREAGKRVFDVTLQENTVIEGLDVFDRAGPDAALDLTYRHVDVDEEGLRIGFTPNVEHPFIAGIVIADAHDHTRILRRINCGGEAVGDYEADLPALGSFPELEFRDRDLPADGFYRDWAHAQFGSDVAAAMAELFTSLDGGDGPYQYGKRSHLPRPSDWRVGPGGIVSSPTPWGEEQHRYAFVDRMADLRTRVQGAANLERFDYWLDTFRLLRAVAHVGCLRGQLDRLIEQMTAMVDAAARRRFARDELLPVREQLARQWEELMTIQLRLVSTPGELGTVANLEQHVRSHNGILAERDPELTAALGAPLPDTVRPTRRYLGEPKLIIPTARTVADEGGGPPHPGHRPLQRAVATPRAARPEDGQRALADD